MKYFILASYIIRRKDYNIRVIHRELLPFVILATVFFLPCCVHKVTCNTMHLRTTKIRDHATLARITTLLDATNQQFR